MRNGRSYKFLVFDTRRRAIRLLEPVVQLKLPFYLLLLTLVFAGAFAVHTHAAYQGLYDAAAASVAPAFVADVQEQTRDFVVVSAAIAGIYVLAMLGLCAGYVYRLIGPITALRRQVEAMKNGDRAGRIALRQSDTVFLELEKDLNELAEMLERGEKNLR